MLLAKTFYMKSDFADGVFPRHTPIVVVPGSWRLDGPQIAVHTAPIRVVASEQAIHIGVRFLAFGLRQSD